MTTFRILMERLLPVRDHPGYAPERNNPYVQGHVIAKHTTQLRLNKDALYYKFFVSTFALGGVGVAACVVKQRSFPRPIAFTVLGSAAAGAFWYRKRIADGDVELARQLQQYGV